MSAIDTCQRVLSWAIEAPATSPPMGSVFGVEQLLQPPEALTRSLGHLAAVTGARLRLPSAPGGAQRPARADDLLITLATGVAHYPQLAQALLQAVPPAMRPRQWVLRHGLVGLALPHLDGDLAHDCRSQSPLTQLLDFPGTVDAAAMAVAQCFFARQNGSVRPAWPTERASLIAHLAEPSCNPQVRRWRALLLDRLRFEYADVVVSVFETMMARHHDAFLEQVRQAHSVFSDALAMSDKDRLTDASATAELWGPLAPFEREHLDALRARRHLGYDYREGLALHHLANRLQEGT